MLKNMLQKSNINKMYTLGSIIVFFGSLGIILCLDYNIVFERVEGIPGDEITLVENVMRISRKGKDYLVNGRLTYHEELGENITHEVTSTYSADGSSLFRSHPYTIQKSSLCDFYKTFYRKYGQSWIQGHTDFPYVPEGGLCPLPKGSWYVKDMNLLNGSSVPMHAPRGIWKMEQKIRRHGKVVGGLRLYAKVTDLV